MIIFKRATMIGKSRDKFVDYLKGSLKHLFFPPINIDNSRNDIVIAFLERNDK